VLSNPVVGEKGHIINGTPMKETLSRVQRHSESVVLPTLPAIKRRITVVHHQLCLG
jgi:hypothetical protein